MELIRDSPSPLPNRTRSLSQETELLMKNLLMLGAIGLLLAFFAPRSSARVKYESRKSHTGDFVLSYDPNFVTGAQAAAVLDDLERSEEPTDEPAVREILRRQGVQNESIKKVVIEKHPGGGKGATILLLGRPAEETAARSAISE
jgi:hypothetical protein